MKCPHCRKPLRFVSISETQYVKECSGCGWECRTVFPETPSALLPPKAERYIWTPLVQCDYLNFSSTRASTQSDVKHPRPGQPGFFGGEGKGKPQTKTRKSRGKSSCRGSGL